MKYIILAVATILLIGGVVTYRALSPTTSSSNQTITQLSTNTKIYDVRTAEEFTASHIANATLFPVTDMQAGKFPDIAKDTPIALYCRTGHRAGQALELMKQAGFTNVQSLGGLSDLKKFGLSAN